MSLLTKLIKSGMTVPRTIYSAFPFQGVSRPVFIIGCGRSGTTIFGKALSNHRDITYLNEPRHLWFSAYPETDIWTQKKHSRKGKLFLTDSDVERRKSNKLSRLFRFETIISRRPVLIEKLPINNFRLRFILKIFPDARFIHIYRNGLEVARSIEKLSEEGHWFGSHAYKWDKLVEYAKGMDDTNNLPVLCKSHFDKGMLEWRLSTEAVVKFLHCLPDDAFYELNYDELMEHPVDTISQVLGFIGIDEDSKVMSYVSDTLARKSSKLSQCNISEKAKLIGGKLLPLSMDGGKELTRRCTWL